MSKRLIETEEKREKAVLVTVVIENRTLWNIEDKEAELIRLAGSCGVEIIHSETCRRKKITPNLFLGKGKIEEIASIAEIYGADVVIFSDDLSPSQQKNIETIIKTKTIDRTQLILDIFASRATSNEGKIQVELAQLVYLLPRLSGKGIELSRLGGGLGTKGLGEQKLEVDRRRLRDRISKLKKELKNIASKRKFRRDRRGAIFPMVISLVGYTNSGKSTLFNVLTESEVKTKNQLFSTLDPTVRKMHLPDNRTVLISDTVGFLNELPHHLIESFKATLEEVVNADILFHVIDISDERIEQKKAAVMNVLEELGAEDKQIFTILNKSDKIPDRMERDRIAFPFRDEVVVSALKGHCIDEIKNKIVDFMKEDMEDLDMVIPHKHYAVVKLIREHGVIKSEEYGESGLEIKAKVPKRIKNMLFKKLRNKS